MDVIRLTLEEIGAAALHEGVAAIGSQSATARILGVTQGAVSKWLRTNKPIPDKHVLRFAEASRIPKERLRPDLFKDETTRAPVAADPLDHAAPLFADMKPVG